MPFSTEFLPWKQRGPADELRPAGCGGILIPSALGVSAGTATLWVQCKSVHPTLRGSRSLKRPRPEMQMPAVRTAHV